MVVYKEKRKSKRVKTRLRINCKGAGIFFSDFTRDIGSEGIGIETAVIIKEGMTVDLFFYLPEHTDPINVKGKVVWSNVKKYKDNDSSLNVLLGIHFENLDDVHRKRLNNFIENYAAQI